MTSSFGTLKKNTTISVDIPVETPKTKDVTTPVQPDIIEEFTALLVGIKASFVNEVFELKNETARLKQAAFIRK